MGGWPPEFFDAGGVGVGEFSEVAWCGAVSLAKGGGKVAVAAVAEFEGDLGDGHAGAGQPLAGTLEALFAQPAVEGSAEGLAEGIG